MGRNEIMSSIDTLLMNKFQVPSEVIMNNNKSQPLIGRTFNIDTITLTYLFFEIQKIFGIKIYFQDLLDYKFITCEGIAEVVERQINHGDK